jgi:hypothetical protein
MHDDNGVTNTNQDQLNPAYPVSPTPFDSGLHSQPAQSDTAQDQNNPVADAPLSEPLVPNGSNFASTDDSKLQDIKRTALQSLLPIVGRLDQSPEEKFQTLLMVIQASDNRELINEAYETAAKIPDEAQRAQALVAIINEINFFTQQPHQN